MRFGSCSASGGVCPEPKEAIEFVEEMARFDTSISERDLKDIHALILRKIDDINTIVIQS